MTRPRLQDLIPAKDLQRLLSAFEPLIPHPFWLLDDRNAVLYSQPAGTPLPDDLHMPLNYQELVQSPFYVFPIDGIKLGAVVAKPGHPAAKALQMTLTVHIDTALDEAISGQTTIEANRKLQELTRLLSRVNRQLTEANKLKSDFLGVISHELRSPFVSIDFGLQAFRRYGVESLAPEQLELLDQLTASFQNARQMVNNLVSYAGLLSKQGRLNLDEVNFTALIEETAVALAPMAESRGLTLRTEVPRNLILPAGDRERLGEAIWHLLHNAIKFTSAGGQVIIRARGADKRLFVEVEDTGPGLTEEKQAKIWESFAQLSDTLKRGVEGLGLGLALVRYVAAAHGGDVSLQSEPGRGSIFGFWLPLQAHYADTRVIQDFFQQSDDSDE